MGWFSKFFGLAVMFLALMHASRAAFGQDALMAYRVGTFLSSGENASPTMRALVAGVLREKLAVQLAGVRLTSHFEDQGNPYFRSTAQAVAAFDKPADNLTVVVKSLKSLGGARVLVEADASCPLLGQAQSNVAGFRYQAGFAANATVRVTAEIELSVALATGKISARPQVTRLEGAVSQVILRDAANNRVAGVLIEQVVNGWIAANQTTLEGLANKALESAAADGRLEVSLKELIAEPAEKQ